MVGHGFARANQKSIVVVPMKGSNKSPQLLGLKVGEHSQFRLIVTTNPLRTRSVNRSSHQFFSLEKPSRHVVLLK